MKVKCYKVVRCSGGQYLSAMSRFLPDEFSLSYKIGEKTVPKIGKIFVFKDYESAKGFIYNNRYFYTDILGEGNSKNGYYIYDFVILVGVSENLSKIKYVASRNSIGEMFNCFEFWRAKMSKKGISGNFFTSLAPFNSFSCSYFIPEEVVYVD